jgi:nucleotide-binding universal stress UspA family protein
MASTLHLLPVVIGVDERPTSRVALDWAIDEAARRGLPLHILHARREPPGSRLGVPGSGASGTPPAVVAEAVAHANALAPQLEVTYEVSVLKPAVALLAASERAECVVVGARGRGSFASAFLGTTSFDVAAHAACPVVVARQFPEIEPARPGVVVGADGSPLSSEAIGYAFAQAAERELPLTVVHVWSGDLDSEYLPTDFATDPAGLREQEKALAAEEVAGWAEKYPDVVVRRHVLRGHPVKALIDHSRGAELVVVGSRGRGGFARMLLGSVSQGVLQHAHCPVAVVRSRHT